MQGGCHTTVALFTGVFPPDRRGRSARGHMHVKNKKELIIEGGGRYTKQYGQSR